MGALEALNRSQWLLAVTALLAVCGVGQVWLVQLSSYHLFAFVGPREFEAYHWAWWRSIWFPVMVPTTVVFTGSILMLWMRPAGVPGWAVWLGFTLEILIALGTAIWWGPLMARLSTPDTGLIVPLYRQLMLTHWIRVALATAYGLLAFWMLMRTLLATAR
jgi:hypothetical protein